MTRRKSPPKQEVSKETKTDPREEAKIDTSDAVKTTPTAPSDAAQVEP